MTVLGRRAARSGQPVQGSRACMSHGCLLWVPASQQVWEPCPSCDSTDSPAPQLSELQRVQLLCGAQGPTDVMSAAFLAAYDVEEVPDAPPSQVRAWVWRRAWLSGWVLDAGGLHL